MSIRLVLADTNTHYMEKLAAWIHKHMPYQFSIEILTHSESFKAWAESGGHADLIVISIGLVKQVLPCLPKEGILVLDDGTHETLSLKAPRVEKYRHAEELAKDILSLCADRMPGMHSREGIKQNITLILYLDGADIINPVAPTIALLFSARNKKTLYLSLEQAQNTSLFFSESGSKGLNEMLYYIKSNRDNLNLRLESCLARDVSAGIDLLGVPAGLLLPGSMERSDITSLLSAACSRGKYHEVILVVDLTMFELLPTLLEESARILFVSLNTVASSIKMERFIQELNKGDMDISRLKEKLRLILVNIGPCNGYSGQFPDMQRVFLSAHPVESAVSEWIPTKSDLEILAAILNDEENAGCCHE